MDTPKHIPLNDIDTTTMPRDRTLICANAQAELRASISQNGLRLPVELYQTETGLALISGYRRFMAFQTLLIDTNDDRYTTIPALIRTPENRQAALAAMVEENEIRQNLSPWERARITVTTKNAGLFETLDAAIATLYPQISRQKRSKLRAITEVVDIFEGHLKDPELLTQNQLFRLAQCLRLGWVDIILTAISEQDDQTSSAQWHRLLPILQEAEILITQNRPTNPKCPRRLSYPGKGLTIRREKTRKGYLLHISGKLATSGLVDDVLDEIERWLRPI
jgi:ParB family chromosome partitioning protein